MKSPVAGPRSTPRKRPSANGPERKILQQGGVSPEAPPNNKKPADLGAATVAQVRCAGGAGKTARRILIDNQEDEDGSRHADARATQEGSCGGHNRYGGRGIPRYAGKAH